MTCHDHLSICQDTLCLADIFGYHGSFLSHYFQCYPVQPTPSTALGNQKLTHHEHNNALNLFTDCTMLLLYTTLARITARFLGRIICRIDGSLNQSIASFADDDDAGWAAEEEPFESNSVKWAKRIPHHVQLQGDNQIALQQVTDIRYTAFSKEKDDLISEVRNSTKEIKTM